ncbi:MAG: carbohydrate binding domain-containing protein, partial [Spirochaetales bacterium]|nr:carbohydrate binding domain-containing protein [Spirochaetales bacterium]
NLIEDSEEVLYTIPEGLKPERYKIFLTISDEDGNKRVFTKEFVVKSLDIAGDYVLAGLKSDDDTGSSSTDNITNKANSLTILGTAPASEDLKLVILNNSLGFSDSIDCTASADGNVEVLLDLADDLEDGLYTLQMVSAVDPSKASSSMFLVIDTTLPVLTFRKDSVDFAGELDDSFVRADETVLDLEILGFDSYLAGAHSVTVTAKDRSGNQGSLVGTVTVADPEVATLANPGFEDGTGLANNNYSSTGGNAPGWFIQASVRRTRLSWRSTDTLEGIGPFRIDDRTFADYFYCYVRSDPEDATGNQGNILWFSETINCGWSEAAQNFYTRSWGSASQKNIKVYKGVTYKFSAYTMNGNGSGSRTNPNPAAGIKVQSSEESSPISDAVIASTANTANWIKLEVEFTPTEDGFVDVILEKYNKSAENDDGGWTHFDEANLEIVDVPRV